MSDRRPGWSSRSLTTLMAMMLAASLTPKVAAADRPGDWTMHQYSLDRTGVNPLETHLNLNNVGRLSLRWSTLADDVVGGTPVIADGIVYYGDLGGDIRDLGGVLHAVDAVTGVQLWEREIEHLGSIMTPTVANGMLYFGTGSADTVYAVDASTGETVWTLSGGAGMFNDPAVDGSIAYVGGTDGIFYALDAFTGAVIWSSDILGVDSDAAVVGDNVYVVGGDFSDPELLALNTADGSVRWRTPIAYEGGSPAVTDGKVFVGGKNYVNGEFGAFDAETGGPLWTFDTPVGSTPAVWNDLVIVGSDKDTEGGAIYAFDADSGTVKWSLDRDMCYSSPAIANGVAYMGYASYWDGPREGGLLALDASTGEILGDWPMGDVVCSSPAVSNGWVYVGSFDEHVYAFSLGTGISLSASVGPPGTPLDINGRRFGPNEVVKLTMADLVWARVRADESGGFAVPTKIPRRAPPGRHRVIARGEATGRSAETYLTVRTEWPMLGMAAERTGWNRRENMISPDNVLELSRWSHIYGGVEPAPSAVAAGGLIYWVFGSEPETDHFVGAIDPETQISLWGTYLPGSAYPSPPTVAQGRVFFGSALGLTVLDAKTGEVLWDRGQGGTEPFRVHRRLGSLSPGV